MAVSDVFEEVLSELKAVSMQRVDKKEGNLYLARVEYGVTHVNHRKRCEDPTT